MVLWGVLPIYWKSLIPISSWTIILYRIVLVFVSSLILARPKYTLREIFAPLRADRSMTRRLLAAGLLITVNWSTFIWAVNAGHVVDTSIGYYIQPLAVCLFGIFLFHEKMTRYKAIAMCLAACSVIILLVHFHRLPWISLGLALTFSVYSAIKKSVTLPPLLSLVYETIFLTPFALVAIIWLELQGMGAFAVASPGQIGLLFLCGFLTAIPLALFASAAQKITLFALGLVEYLSPSISLTLGVLLFHEAFDRVQFFAVGLIWVGLCFFTIGEYREHQN